MISMKVQGNVISMLLYNYILKSPFWSHRDVIIKFEFFVINNRLA